MKRALTPLLAEVTLRTLGGVELIGNPFRRPKPLLLLAYLALEGPKDKRFLAELFFPESGDQSGSLRQTLARLRGAAPNLIEGDGRRLWTPHTGDAAAFLGLLEVRDLERAVALYGGPFLTGVALPDLGVELEEWVYGTREFLAGALRGALLTLADEASSLGNVGAATRYAERAYQTEGAPELEPELFAPLHALLAAGGSPLAPVLRKEADEVGVALAVVPSLPERSRAEPLFASGVHPASLARQGGPFVGREAEQIKLADLLFDPEVRLLTLLGPGGVGKTRLALEVATAQRERFAGGVVVAALETLASPAGLPVALAGALGLRLNPDDDALVRVVQDVGDRNVLLVLDNFEHLLAVTPELERLISQCPRLKLLVTSRERLRTEAEWVYPLGGLNVPPENAALEEALDFDATKLFVGRAKRARLSFELTPQELPDVLKVCRAVEGSPLGIELAAGWVKLLSCREIAEELERSLDLLATTMRDAPARQESVRAMFESSWKRLSDAERSALARLSVFRGGFTRQAAAEVAGATLPVLASLVDKSFLRLGERGRFERHLLVYRFTQEKLVKNPEEEGNTKAAHAAYFLAFAQEARPKLQGGEQGWWLERLDDDLDNLRAALGWFLSGGKVEGALLLGSALQRYWRVRGYLREGRAWLAEALSKAAEAPSSLARAKALSSSGTLAWLQGDLVEARRLLEASVRLSRELGEPLEAALTLGNLGGVLYEGGDYGSARTCYEESVAICRDLADAWGTASALHNLGLIALAEGDLRTAQRRFEASLPLCRGLGNPSAVAANLNSLARVARRRGDLALAGAFYEEVRGVLGPSGDPYTLGLTLLGSAQVRAAQGDWDGALARFGEALRVQREVGDQGGIVDALEGLASLLRHSDPAHAARLWGACDRARNGLGHARPPADGDAYRAELAEAQDALSDEAFAAAWNEGQRLGIEEAVDYALKNDPCNSSQ